MKVLLHPLNDGPTLRGRYEAAAAALRLAGHEVNVVTGVAATDLDLGGVDLLVSHWNLPPHVRQQLPGRCFGGRRWTRGEQLTALAQHGFPTMQWARVDSQAEALALFQTWGVDKLIVKRSFTGSGAGFHVLTPGQVRYGAWDFQQDVVCREVNPQAGTVYKVELFNGRLLASYTLNKAPLGQRLLAGELDAEGFRRLALYRDRLAPFNESLRSVVELPDAEKALVRQLSARLTNAGFGLVCGDFMRQADGTLVAIELNLSGVVTWYSDRVPGVRTRFADALVALAQAVGT